MTDERMVSVSTHDLAIVTMWATWAAVARHFRSEPVFAVDPPAGDVLELYDAVERMAAAVAAADE